MMYALDLCELCILKKIFILGDCPVAGSAARWRSECERRLDRRAAPVASTAAGEKLRASARNVEGLAEKWLDSRVVSSRYFPMRLLFFFK